MLIALNNLRIKYLSFPPHLSPPVFPPSSSNDTVCSDLFVCLRLGPAVAPWRLFPASAAFEHDFPITALHKKTT